MLAHDPCKQRFLQHEDTAQKQNARTKMLRSSEIYPVKIAASADKASGLSSAANRAP
jgi:hypothetical protein